MASLSAVLLLSCERGTGSSAPAKKAPLTESTFQRSYTPVRSCPPPGRYRLLEDFVIEGCVKHGGGFEGAGCLEKAAQTYKKGDLIDVERFFWDDRAKECGAKVVVFHTFRSIPLGLIAQVH